MFKVLIYYSAYDKLVEMVTKMKKIGIDVGSHQSANQVLSQTIEFNADFIIFETGKDPDETFAMSEKLHHLLSPPTIILIKNEDEILNSGKVMASNISKVFTEPIEQDHLIAYMLEVKGLDPQEYFDKYLKTDYIPKHNKKTASLAQQNSKVEQKFSERDYLNSFTQMLEEVDVDPNQSLASDKLEEFKKNAEPVDLDASEESERDRFMKALLTGKPGD